MTAGAGLTWSRRVVSLASRRRPSLPVVVWLSCALGLAALTFALVHGWGIQQLDAVVRDAVRVPDGATSRIALRALSAPGQRGVIWPGLVVLALVQGRREHTWRPVLWVLVALTSVSAAVIAFKLGIGRTAPRSGQDLLAGGGRSYPSGHAANEVVGLGLAVALLARTNGPRTLNVLTVMALATVAAVGGAAVVIEDFHWTSDVLAGWLLGGCLLAIGCTLTNKRISPDPCARPQPRSSP